MFVPATEIGQLSEITSLYLEDNRLTEFPTILFQLSHLQHLYLSGNDIQSLPEFSDCWEQLEVLYLANCGLVVGIGGRTNRRVFQSLYVN